MADRTIKPDSGNDLVLQNNGGTGKIEINDGAEIKVTTGSASGDDFTVNTSQLVVQGDSGSVGLGISTLTGGNVKLDINKAGSGIGSQIRFQNSHNADFYLGLAGDTTGEVILYNGGNTDMKFSTNGNQRMEISDDGDIHLASGPLNIDASTNTQKGFGVSNSAGTAHVATNSGTTGLLVQTVTTVSSPTTHNLLFFLNRTTNVGEITTNGTSTNYSTTSDYRLKENITSITGAIDRLNQLKPSRFNFIANPDNTVDEFLAHEVSDFVPEAVTGEKDAMITEEFIETEAVFDDEGNEITPAIMGTREVIKPQGIDQSKLVPLLVASVQELSAKVAALENA